MNSKEFHQQCHFIMIGILMTIISLAFLLYMGNYLVKTTKEYKERAVEIMF